MLAACFTAITFNSCIERTAMLKPTRKRPPEAEHVSTMFAAIRQHLAAIPAVQQCLRIPTSHARNNSNQTSSSTAYTMGSPARQHKLHDAVRSDLPSMQHYQRPPTRSRLGEPGSMDSHHFIKESTSHTSDPTKTGAAFMTKQEASPPQLH
ncbi:hypothetical protein MRB53_041512 [Persea americana]|nr:hypothetical protein MRB53_041512 [Persea americana]